MTSPFRCIRFRSALALGVLLAAIAVDRPPAAAATITVGSTADVAADDGTCTLREAIASASANAASGVSPGECAAGDAGSDDIAFALGAGTPTIALLSPLPALAEPVTLDGGTGGATRVELGSTGNAVEGSRIGIDASGAADLGNGDFGVLGFTADNEIALTRREPPR